MTCQYKVNPFVTYDLNDELIIQTKVGIDKITEKNRAKLILELRNSIGKTIDGDIVLDFLNKLKIDEGFLDYLFNRQIVSKKIPLQMGLQDIYFYSPDKSYSKKIRKIFENEEKIKILDTEEDLVDKVRLNQSDLFIIFYREYSKAEAIGWRDLFKYHANTFSSMAYIYNEYLYIDSLYSAKWNLPCHLCHKGFIENEHRIGAEENVTYQIMIDELFESDHGFKLSHSFSNSQELNILTQLCNFITKLSIPTSRLANAHSPFINGAVFDIQENVLSKGTTRHWELCDCYE